MDMITTENENENRIQITSAIIELLESKKKVDNYMKYNKKTKV